MRKFLLKWLLVAFVVMPWVTMSQVTDYNCDFEDDVEVAQWEFINGTCKNKWIISSSVNNGGSRSLYISHDEAADHDYVLNKDSKVFACRTLTLVSGTYDFSYDWRSNGESGSQAYDYLRVAIAPASAVIEPSQANGVTPTSVPSGWIEIDGGSALNQSDTWRTKSGTVTIPTSGDYKLVFYWKNDFSGGHQGPAAIDNITFALPSCPSPADLVSSERTSDGFTVSWTGVGNVSTWIVECVPHGDSLGSALGTITTVNDTNIVLTGLNANSSYDVYVKSDCGNETSRNAMITVKTLCATIELPYNYSFEDVEEYAFPDCWTRVEGGAYVVENGYGDSYTTYGTHALMMNNNDVVATPYIPLMANMIEMEFMLKCDGSDAGVMEFYFTTSLTDLSNMVGIDTISLDEGDSRMIELGLTMLDVTDEGYIVIKNSVPYTATSGYYLDNVTIRQRPNCGRPASLSVRDITYNSALLAWTEVMDASEYEVAFGVDNDPNSMNNEVLTHVVGDNLMLNNLLSNTRYYAWIRTNCGTEYSEWRSCESFKTDVSCATVKDVEICNSNATGVALMWRYNEQVGTTATQTEVAWKLSTGNHYMKTVTSNQFYIIQGLQPNSEYNLRLRTICGADTAEAYEETFATGFSGKYIEGNGTSTSVNVPTSTNYKHTYSQMIYPASDLSGIDTIRNFGFHVSGYGTSDRTWDVYMGNIKRSTLTPTTYVTLDSLTLVASNYIFAMDDEWAMVQLTTPFVCASDSNLVIAIHDKTGEYRGSTRFYVHDGFSMAKRTDAFAGISPSSPTGMSTYNVVPDIVFAQPLVEGTCLTPLLALGEVSATTAQLSWNRVDAALWEVAYKLPSETEWNIVESAVTDTTALITDLTPGTRYEFRVGYTCNGEMMYATVTGYTECAAVSVPYIEDFSGSELNPCWTIGNLEGNSLPNLSSNSLYMGLYEGGYLILPEVADNLSSLHIMFDMQSIKDSTQLEIAMGDDPNDWSTFIPYDTIWIMEGSSVKVPQECNFIDYDGNGRYIALHSLTRQIYVDDILLETAPLCSYPSDVTVSNVLANNATITWRGDNSNTSLWMLVYNIKGVPNKDTIDVASSNFTYTLSGLQPNTEYELLVHNICVEDTIAALSMVSFRTTCGNMVLPYHENFESAEITEYHPCWFTTEMHQYGWNYEEAPLVVKETNSQNKVMRFCDNSDMITPYIADAINSIKVCFDAKITNVTYGGDLAIGYTTSNTDLTNAVYLDTIDFVNTQWASYEIPFGNAVRTDGGYVVFKNINNTPYEDYDYSSGWTTEYFSEGFIDNLVIMEDSGCDTVTNIEIQNIVSGGADITFTDPNNVGNYTVAYSVVNDLNNITTVNVSTTGAYLSGLLSGTRYYIWVRTNCAAGGSMWAEGPSFVTPCEAISTLPYEEDFDSYTTDIASTGIPPTTYPNHTMPTCWSFLNMSNRTNEQPHAYLCKDNNSYHNYADSATCLLFYSKAYTPIYAVLPSFSTHVSALEISFTYRNEANRESAGIIQLGVMTDANDTATFQMVAEFPRMATLTEASHNFALDDLDANINYTMAFRYMGGTGNRFYAGIDNVVVSRAEGCFTPENITLNSVSDNDANISWSGIADSYNVQYKLSTDTSWIDMNTTTETQVTIGGLEAFSTYEMRVQSNCGIGVSEWSDIFIFTTACGVMNIPYTENFDSYVGDIATGTGAPMGYPSHTMPSCWNFVGMSTTSYQNPKVFLTKLAAYRVTGNSMFFTSHLSDPVYAILPEMNEDLDLLQITFSYRNEGTNANNPHVMLGVMTDPTDTNTFTLLETYNPSLQFATVSYSFANAQLNANETYYIAFRYGGEGANFMYMSIDDIVVDYVPTCVKPSSPIVEACSFDNAHIRWNGTASNYEVNYRVDTIPSWSDTLVSSDNIILSGLSATTDYEVRVRAICSDEDTSDWSEITSFTTTCAPNALPFTENFDGETVETIKPCWSRCSGVLSNIQAGTEQLVDGGTWRINDSYPISNDSESAYIDIWNSNVNGWLITPSITISEVASLKFDMARYDYQENDVWSDDDKFVVLVSSDNGNTWVSEKTWLGTAFVNIPEYTNTSMRVTVDLTRYLNDTIRVAFYGESRIAGGDHYIIIDNILIDAIDPMACLAPQDLAANNITTNSVDLSWTGTANSYDVAYHETGDVVWTTQTVTETSYSLTDLQPATDYEWRVRANCGGVLGSSEWVYSAFNTVAFVCETPTELTATAEGNSVTLDWTAAEGQSQWEISLTTASMDEQLEVVTTHPTTIENLINGANYTAKVRAICGEGMYSEWSESVEFATEICQPVSNVAVSEITETSAKISWTAGGDELSWLIEYGELDFAQGEGRQVTVDTTTYILTGLSADTDYDVFVRAVCGEGFNSLWSDVVRFTTLQGHEGIDGVDGQYSLSIYPNPTHGATTIRLNGVEGKVTISIVDMNGRYIASERVECGNDCEKRIDVTDLAQGTYFVRVLGDNINSVRKLVVR